MKTVSQKFVFPFLISCIALKFTMQNGSIQNVKSICEVKTSVFQWLSSMRTFNTFNTNSSMIVYFI